MKQTLRLLRSIPFTVAMIWFVWSGHDLRWAVTALIIIAALLDAVTVATQDWMGAAQRRLIGHYRAAGLECSRWPDPDVRLTSRKCATPGCPWGADNGRDLCAKCMAS